MEHSNDVKIFAGSTGRYFAEKICKYLNLELSKSNMMKFSDGNIYVKAEESIREKDVYLIQSIGMNPNDEFTEILFWIDAFKRAGSGKVTLIMPYFSYAKGDKKDEPRVSIRARVIAECIELAGVDRVVTMDLHAPQIQGFFKKPVDNLFALPILCEYVKGLNIENLVVVSPDAGYAKEARRYAKHLGAGIALADKTRSDHLENPEIHDLIGEVRGMNCLIVDDFTISGGTLIELAKLLKEKGANKIYCCLSHILLKENGVEKLMDSPIELLISTDSLANPYVRDCEKISLISVAPLFAEVIDRLVNKKSVSPLFEEVPMELYRESQIDDDKNNI